MKTFKEFISEAVKVEPAMGLDKIPKVSGRASWAFSFDRKGKNIDFEFSGTLPDAKKAAQNFAKEKDESYIYLMP